MTDEHTGVPEPPDHMSPPQEQPSAEGMGDSSPTPAASGAMQNMFSTGEGMVAFAGMILVVDYLIFGLILNDYWVGWIAVILSVIAIAAPRLDRSFVEKVASLPVIMKVTGYLIAVVGVLQLIEDVRFASSQLDDFTEIIGGLALYGASAIAFLGARQIDT